MKKIKNSLCIATMAVLSFSMVSCENENIGTNLMKASELEASTNDLNASHDDGLVKTRSSNSISYEVSNAILGSFIHFCQRMAGPNIYSNYPGAFYTITDEQAHTACCPTSYMMAVACLKHADGDYSFSADAWNLAEILDRFNDDSYMKVEELKNVCEDYETDIIMETKHHLGDRSGAKKFLQNALDDDKFVIVPIFANVSSFPIVNNSDLYSNNENVNPDLQTGSSNSGRYIRVNTTNITLYGHIILIIGIEVKSEWGNDGIVTYIDPLAKTRNGQSNRRYVRYSRLLNSMQNQSYRVLSLGK